MFKKVASLVGAGALLLSVSGVAFARGYYRPMPSVDRNTAIVTNTTSSVADTGLNSVGNSVEVRRAGVRGEVEIEGDNRLTTGAANSEAVGVVVANTQVGCSTCGRNYGTTVREDLAIVNNSTSSEAYTGSNSVGNSAEVSRASVGGRRGGEVEVEGNNTVTTGGATSSSTGVVVVNTQLSWR